MPSKLSQDSPHRNHSNHGENLTPEQHSQTTTNEQLVQGGDDILPL